MAEDELVEVKFRLFDGSSIGPFRFLPRATVAMLKRRIVAEWPKDKKIAPRTANDVKLINAGMVLENSKNIAQSKTPLVDLRDGVITMHAVVQPALAEAKKECQKTSLGDLLEKAEENTRRAEEKANKAADDVVTEIAALKQHLTDAREVVVAAEKCKVEVVREFFRSPTYEYIMMVRGMYGMKLGFILAIAQIKTLKGFVEGFNMKQLSLTLGPGTLVTGRAQELLHRIKEEEVQRMTKKMKDAASSSGPAESSRPVCSPVAASPTPAASSVVPLPPPSRDPVSPLGHVTRCGHKQPSSSSTAAEERAQEKRPVVDVGAVEDQLTAIGDHSKNELFEMKLNALLEKAEENVRRAQEKAKKAADDIAAEITALKQQLVDARAASEAAEKNISAKLKVEVVEEFFRSPTFLKIGRLRVMVDKKYGFDLAIDQIKTLKGFVEGFDTKQLSVTLGPKMEVTPDGVGVASADHQVVDPFSCLLLEPEIWWVGLPEEFDPSSLPMTPTVHQ